MRADLYVRRLRADSPLVGYTHNVASLLPLKASQTKLTTADFGAGSKNCGVPGCQR